MNNLKGETSILLRVIDVLTYSRMSKNAFAKKINMEQTTVNNQLLGKRGVSIDLISNILKNFEQISPEWLITGNGNMLKDPNSVINPIQGDKNTIQYKNTSEVELTATSSRSIDYKLVPLLNLDAVGGMHSLNAVSGSQEYIEKLIPFTDAQEGDVALVVSGNSMDPTCPAGSKVLLREVVNWNEYFGFGNIFVIHLTDNRRILKEVQKFPEDPKNYVLCKSHNDKYPEEELPKSMIKSVWKVVKILNERGW